MFVSIFSTNFVWDISHSKTKWASYDKKWILVSMYSTLYSSPILMKLEFSWQEFGKTPQISNFIKICPVEADLFHADGRMDGQMDRRADVRKPIVALLNFANATKNWLCRCN